MLGLKYILLLYGDNNLLFRIKRPDSCVSLCAGSWIHPHCRECLVSRIANDRCALLVFRILNESHTHRHTKPTWPHHLFNHPPPNHPFGFMSSGAHARSTSIPYIDRVSAVVASCCCCASVVLMQKSVCYMLPALNIYPVD